MMDLPIGPSEISLTYNRNVRAQRSPFTGRRQEQLPTNEWWEGEIVLPPLTDEEAAEWRTWLLALKGRSGTFQLGPYYTNRGAQQGSPAVNGGSQLGRLLQTNGWDSSVTGVLLAGDYIEVSGRLYRVTRDADSDTSGNADLRIWPRLRESPASGAPITLTDPTGPFRFTSAENAWSVEPGPFTNFTLEVREAL